MRHWTRLLTVALVGTLAALAWAKEERVSLEDCPQAVQDTILKEANGATITEIEREIENGKTVYEAEWMEDGMEVEITVAEDGTLLEREV